MPFQGSCKPPGALGALGGLMCAAASLCRFCLTCAATCETLSAIPLAVCLLGRGSFFYARAPWLGSTRNASMTSAGRARTLPPIKYCANRRSRLSRRSVRRLGNVPRYSAAIAGSVLRLVSCSIILVIWPGLNEGAGIGLAGSFLLRVQTSVHKYIISCQSSLSHATMALCGASCCHTMTNGIHCKLRRAAHSCFSLLCTALGCSFDFPSSPDTFQTVNKQKPSAISYTYEGNQLW